MTKIPTRITSLERWGMRASMDFQPEAVAYVREAGLRFLHELATEGDPFARDLLAKLT